MPRYKDEPPAVGVYSLCDESRYLIVRNVPSLGCGDDLLKLFASYGEVEDELESRAREVLGRLNPGRSKGSTLSGASTDPSLRAIRMQTDCFPQHVNSSRRDSGESQLASHVTNPPLSRISSDQEYFPSQSMNQTVKMVREKLNKVITSMACSFSLAFILGFVRNVRHFLFFGLTWHGLMLVA